VDLEQHLINNERIVTKCKTSDIYSQNLYAALCNNQFFYGDKTWTCSWRMSGGIVADIRGLGESYLDFYCSGIGSKEGDVGEGFVTDEIKLDLMMMGWTVRDHHEYIKDCRKLLKESNNEKESL
jgi:hypothetical protein